MDFKGAIFDMDGTLIDSMYIWNGVSKQFLLDHGITPPDDIEEIVKSMGTTQSSKYFISEFGLQVDEAYIIDYFGKLVEEKYRKVKAKPFAMEYLKKLKAEGKKMCVATATVKVIAQETVDRLGISDYIEFLTTCEDVGESKEKPDIFLKAAERLGLAVEDVVVFEDTLVCVNTAKNAGFYTVGVADESSKDKKESIAKLSHKFIESFEELM